MNEQEFADMSFPAFLFPDELLDDLLDQSYGAVKEVIQTGVPYLPPLLEGVALNEHRHVVPFMLPVAIDDNRYALMRALGEGLVGRAGLVPLAVVFIAEGWMATETPENGDNPGEFIPPSQRPDRKECITLFASTIDARSCSIFAETLRDERGNMVIGAVMENHRAGREQPESRITESALVAEFWVGALNALRATVVALLDHAPKPKKRPATPPPMLGKVGKDGLPGSESVM